MLELMITLTLAGLIMGIGVPAFRNFAKNGRLTGAANEMLVTIVSARNEAVRRQLRTSFCPSTTPDADLAICASTATQGYIAFVDLNSNCQRDVGEEIISNFVVHSEVTSKKNLTCIGFGSNGFRIPTTGNPSNARAVFCDSRGIAKVTPSSTDSVARGVEIVGTGRPAVTRLFADLNTWAGGATPVTCP